VWHHLPVQPLMVGLLVRSKPDNVIKCWPAGICRLCLKNGRGRFGNFVTASSQVCTFVMVPRPRQIAGAFSPDGPLVQTIRARSSSSQGLGRRFHLTPQRLLAVDFDGFPKRVVTCYHVSAGNSARAAIYGTTGLTGDGLGSKGES
jgi:hypothetical protein